MKKICLFVLLAVISTAVMAQELRTPMAVKTRFGLKAGINMAQFDADDYPSGAEPKVDRKNSLTGGVLVNIPFSSMFAVQPELVYSSQGSKLTQSFAAGGVTISEKWEQDLKYINLPVMLQFRSPGGFFVEAGPQAGFLFSAKQDGPGNNETENESRFKKLDFAAGAGLGYLSRIGLGLNARYNHGFTNIWDDDSVGDAALRNRVIQFSLFYLFGAHK